MESGEVNPTEMACPDCGKSGDAAKIEGLLRMWTFIAAQKAIERIERAGLTRHYENVAREIMLRRDNRQN